MLRKINYNDLSSIYELGGKYDSIFSKVYDLKSYLENPIYILNCYVEEGIIEGFIIANKLYDTVEILLIYVDDKYRQQGVATKLLESLEKKAVNNLLLEVSVQNEPALNLYKKLGYEILNTRKKYYNGTDAYVMKKVLK